MAEFTRQDTAHKVIVLLSEKLSMNDAASINEQATLEQLGADSLDIVEIIMRLEEQFGVQIADTQAEQLSTVKDVIELVHSLRTK